MAIDDGLYRIHNTTNDEVLELSNGNWEYGEVRTFDSQAFAHNTDGWKNQHWLVAKIPGTDEYQIINEVYGVLAGVFAGERNGSWQVRAAPISTHGWATRWKLQDLGNWVVYIRWKMDPEHRCLDIDSGNSHGIAQAANFDPNNQHMKFRLERINFDQPHDRWASWMRNVPDDTHLSMLNIPGTHQSLATHGISTTDNPHCQNRGVYQQLVDGIRFLDLRFDRWTSGNEQSSLYARHGVANMGYTLAAVMQALKTFLQRFPSEVVFINVVNETGTEGFRTSWDNDYNFFKDIFYYPTDKSPRMSNLLLGQVRGKVICHDMIWQGGEVFRGR